MAPAGEAMPHYEVVDDRNALVGNMKHTTEQQARQLHEALAQPGGRALHVAIVTETVVIRRHVARIAKDGIASANPRTLAA